MEFFALDFWVKRVSCFPHNRGPFQSPHMMHSMREQDKVVAVASSAVDSLPQTHVYDVLGALKPSVHVTRMVETFHVRCAI